jgi:hypothetical protein
VVCDRPDGIRVRPQRQPEQTPLWCSERSPSGRITKTRPQCTTVGPLLKTQGWEARVIQTWEREWGRRWGSFKDRTFWCKNRSRRRISCEVCACLNTD